MRGGGGCWRRKALHNDKTIKKIIKYRDYEGKRDERGEGGGCWRRKAGRLETAQPVRAVCR